MYVKYLYKYFKSLKDIYQTEKLAKIPTQS